MTETARRRRWRPFGKRPESRGSRNACCPPTAYTSAEVLAWEQRHLFAGSWTCLGRLADLFPDLGRDGRSR